MLKFLTLCGTLLLIFSCRTPQAHLARGHYQKAADRAVRLLDRGKDRQGNTLVLSQAAHTLFDQKSRTKERLMQTGEPPLLVEALHIVRDLGDLSLEVAPHLGNAYVDHYHRLRQEEAQLEETIGKAYLQLGQDAMQDYLGTGDKQAAQQAYTLVANARSYGLMGPDTEDLLQRSFLAGHFKYVFELEPVLCAPYNWAMRTEFDKLERHNSLFRSVRVIDDPVQELTADCHVTLDFGEVLVSYGLSDSQTARYSEEVIVGHEELPDDKGNLTIVPIFEEVTAQVEIRETVKKYTLDLVAEAYTATGHCTMQDASFSTIVHQTVTEVVSDGDVRALPARYRGQDGLLGEDEAAAMEQLIQKLYREVEAHFL